jgi:hypothetical protein
MSKRIVGKKISGVSAKGTKWYAFALACSFDVATATLYKELLEFVSKAVWDVVKEGQEISIA